MLYASHNGARALSLVFLVMATIILIVGGVSTYTYPRYRHIHDGFPTAQCVYLGIEVAIGTIVCACALAFFGYALDLLVQSELNSRETALNVSRDEVPAPPKRYI